ncbi:bifunctional demethylmenaquinone methyltransferase/2-methoxy-6-polyprenyl-1,4-benzoquinol methylase UbiE [Flavobacteriaceae bacterium]|nr:bifunctional demethylmenaquinone methyltransferase/2-methoxy-6-polyprenyl-1,4-benzoquinol methylase UbiE [Flavobacteriaceae bacterium]
MTKKVTPYKQSDLGKKQQVTKMFDNISENYDGLNRVMTFGIDVSWRKKVVALIKKSGAKSVLDIATGTGDLAIMIAENTEAKKVIGLDISSGMLEVGKEKVSQAALNDKIEMVLGDSEKLPFEENSFDAITVSYGVRNFEDLNQGLSEIYRVLKPGGLFVVLETSVPTKFPFKQGYFVYSKTLLPLIGKLFSKDKQAYTYLSNSAKSFPYGKAFNNILSKNSFIEAKDYPVTFGVSTIYTASK